MYVKAITRIFERLVKKHNEKGESFRTLSEFQINNVLKEEIREWNRTIRQKVFNVKHEIEELCDIVVASIIKIEWLIQGGQQHKMNGAREMD